MNKNMKKTMTVLLLVLAAGCSTRPQDGAFAPPMDPSRKVAEQDCSRQIDTDRGNLMCREVSEAERRARLAEEERQARAKREAEERAARERLERERAEQLALAEAARKAREAEEARLAAERARLEAEERARKEKAEAEARARKEKEEAEARERERAAQEAREAAARECQRLEQVRSEGRAMLENFVATYGAEDEFKGIAGQISAFLKKARKPKPCPPA